MYKNKYTINADFDDDFEGAPYRPDDAFFDEGEDDDIPSELDVEKIAKIRNDLLAFIKDMLANLGEAEPYLRDIVANRFPLQHGYAQINSEIGAIFGVSEQAIRISMKKAIARLGNAQFYSTVHDICSGLGYESTKAIKQAKQDIIEAVTEAATA